MDTLTARTTQPLEFRKLNTYGGVGRVLVLPAGTVVTLRAGDAGRELVSLTHKRPALGRITARAPMSAIEPA